MHGKAIEDEDLWRRLDWNDVRIFLAVAEAGSLNAAARVLGMTQPTISRRMEDFEFRLRARLFDRSSRGVALTESGEMVRGLAQSMARFGGSIVRDVAGRDHDHTGRVRLSAPDGIASFLLAPQLAKFQMANPQIYLAIDCGLWVDTPLEGENDLFLEFTETGAADLISLPLATVHHALFASRQYLNTYGTPKTVAEVADHRWVRHPSHREQRSTWNPKVTAVTTLADVHFISNSSATTFQAIRHGAGIGFLPTYVAALDPELVMLDLEPMGRPLLFLRHHPAIEHQARVKRVKEWLIELFDPAESPWFREEFIHPRDFARYRSRGRTTLPGKAMAHTA